MSSSPGSAVSRRARPPPRATVQMSPAYTKAIESRDRVGNRRRRVAAASSGSAAPGEPGDRATKRALRMVRAAQIGGTERGDGARRIADSLVVGAPRFYSLYRPGVKSFRVHAAPGGAPAGHGSGLLRKPPLASPRAAHRAGTRAAGPRRAVSDGPSNAGRGASCRAYSD